MSQNTIRNEVHIYVLNYEYMLIHPSAVQRPVWWNVVTKSTRVCLNKQICDKGWKVMSVNVVGMVKWVERAAFGEREGCWCWWLRASCLFVLGKGRLSQVVMRWCHTKPVVHPPGKWESNLNRKLAGWLLLRSAPKGNLRTCYLVRVKLQFVTFSRHQANWCEFNVTDILS